MGGGEMVPIKVLKAGKDHAFLSVAIVYANDNVKRIEKNNLSEIKAEEFSCGDHNDELKAFCSGLKDLKVFEGVQTGDRPGGFAMTATLSDGVFLVCTQGTSTLEDAEQDLRAAVKVEVDLGGTKYTVGAGWKNQYEELMDKQGMMQHIDANIKTQGQKVLVTGHSLGGALANLIAIHIRNKYPDCQLHLSTYGAPRAFATADADRIQAKMIKDSDGFDMFSSGGKLTAWRFLNYGDVVPSLPPSTMGFKHVGKGFYINQRMGEKDVTCKVQHQDFSAYSVGGMSVVGTHKVSGHLAVPFLDRFNLALQTHGKLMENEESKNGVGLMVHDR